MLEGEVKQSRRGRVKREGNSLQIEQQYIHKCREKHRNTTRKKSALKSTYPSIAPIQLSTQRTLLLRPEFHRAFLRLPAGQQMHTKPTTHTLRLSPTTPPKYIHPIPDPCPRSFSDPCILTHVHQYLRAYRPSITRTHAYMYMHISYLTTPTQHNTHTSTLSASPVPVSFLHANVHTQTNTSSPPARTTHHL